MNYKDAELLNGALDQISGSLLQRKMLEEQARERSAQTGLQQERLQVDQDRWNKTAAYQTRMESKADQQNSLLQNRAALQDKQAMLENIFKLNAGGMLDDDALDSVNDFLAKDEHFGTTGIQLSKPAQKVPTMQGLPTAVGTVMKIKEFRDKANDMRDPDSANFDPDGADEQDSYGDLLEGALKKPQAADESVTEELEFPGQSGDEGTPGSPATGLGGLLRIGQPAVPAVPAKPSQPKRKIIIKHPPGWRLPAATPPPAPGTNAAPSGAATGAQGQKPTRAQARIYVDKYGGQAATKLQADGYDTSGYAD